VIATGTASQLARSDRSAAATATANAKAGPRDWQRFPGPDRRRVKLHRAGGFSLLELLVALAILGILVSIAYPSYTRYLVRANRADAQTQLTQAAQWMERYYTTHDSYTAATLPSNLAQSPASGTAVYNLSFNPPSTASSYTLVATPTRAGLNGTDGVLQLDSQRNKAWDRNNNGTIDSGEDTWNP
jgi:type IV pilus assembly protein PilE